MSTELLKSSIFLSSSRFFARGLGLISTFIVARLLTPEDYGVIAIAMIVQDFAFRMQNIGFSQNLVTSKTIDKTFMSTIFYTRFTVFALLTFCIYLLAPFFGEWMNSPDVGQVLKLICWVILLNGLMNLNVIVQTRKNNFIPEIKIAVFSKLVSVFTTIIAAYFLNSYLALALGMLSAAISQLIFSYLVTPAFKPSRGSFKQVIPLLKFSKWFFYQTLVMFVNTKAPHLVIAKFFSEKILGQISMATNIVQMYSQEITASFDKANFAYLSKKLNEADRAEFPKIITDNTNYLIGVKNILIIPVYCYCSVYSSFVVTLLLGDNWTSISPIFSLLCFAAIATSYETVFRTVFNSLRKPKINFKLSIISLLCLTVVMLLSVKLNNYWFIIYGSIITNLLITFSSLFYLYKFTRANLVKSFLNSLVLVFLCTLCAYIIHHSLDSQLLSSFLYWSIIITLLVFLGRRMRILFILDILNIINNLKISLFHLITKKQNN